MSSVIFRVALVIVTGNRQLLGLKGFEGTGIITVAELLYTFPSPPRSE